MARVGPQRHKKKESKILQSVYIGLPIKCPILFQIIMTFKLSQQLFEKSEIPYLMKIVLVGAELYRADGWTAEQTGDMTKLTVAFCNYANTSTNCTVGGRGVRATARTVSYKTFMLISASNQLSTLV